MSKTMKEALAALLLQMQDPAFVEAMVQGALHRATLEENEYDLTGVVPWSVGDSVAYALDSGHADGKAEALRLGSYSRHGQGD